MDPAVQAFNDKWADKSAAKQESLIATGAARLAGEAALRAGAGRVTAWVAPESATAVAAGCPELMVRGLGTAAASSALLEAADVLAIGPGLGRSEWSRASFANALAAARTHEQRHADH